jgi:small subunit ribosomal protein S16
MAVKLRMTRMGRRNRPYFRINAIDSRTPRDGKIIEKLGHYDPIEKDKSRQVVLNTERVKYWLDKGAIPSDTVSEILLKLGIKTKCAEERVIRRGRARGQPFTKAERAATEKAASKAEEEAKTQAEAKAKADKEVKAKAEAEAKVKVETPEVVEEKAEVKAAAEPKAKVKKEAKAKEEAVKEAKAKTETKQKAEEEQKPDKKKKPVRVKKIDKSDEN